MLYILHWIYLINTVYICLISSLCSLLEQFLSHFLVLPRASDFCSLFVSLPKEMNLFYPELIYLPSARNWTQLLEGDWINFENLFQFEPIHRKVKVTFKAIIDETSFWESPSPHLKLFFPSIQLPQLHWSQILMKLGVGMS